MAYRSFYSKSGLTEKAWSKILGVPQSKHREYATFTTKVPAHTLNRAGKNRQAHEISKTKDERQMTQTLFPENVAPNATKLLVDSKNVAYHAYSWALKAYDGEDVQAAYFVCFWAKIKFAARRCRTTRIAFCLG